MARLLTDPLTEPGNILDALAPAIMVTDADWNIRFVNRTLTRALRCEADDLVGKHMLVAAGQFAHLDASGEMMHRLVQCTLLPPQEPVIQIVPIRVPERKFVRVRVQPYWPERGITGYMFLFIDSTHESEVDEMKNEFISVASHEMRTPMTSIKGSLELLLGGYAGELPPEAIELLGISLTAVDRLVRLINDLLDIAKIESGKMEFHLERLDLNDCVRKAMRGVRSLAEAHKVALVAETPPAPAGVLGDRDRIEQVITNLLSNALKYSPADSEVKIQVAEGMGAVRVSVIDRGPGIPADQLEKVFDRFHQLKGAKKGSGLGLTICRALVEQHRGRIWVESELGKGSQFHFELPAAPAEQAT